MILNSGFQSYWGIPVNQTRIKAVRGPNIGHNRDIPTIVGVMNAGTLTSYSEVPIYKHDGSTKQTGYQRIPSQIRVKTLAQDILKKSVDFPTAVLLSLRTNPFQDFIANDDDFTINVSDFKDIKFYVVDGQHRIAALKKAMLDDSLQSTEIAKIKIPFVCMLGANEAQEMAQFHIINTNAKPISTSLAFSLLKERSQNDVEFSRLFEEKGQKWKIEAQSITEKICSRDGIWNNRIRLPNMGKGITITTSASFAKSLKPVLDSYTLKKERDIDKKVQIVMAYWNAVNKIIPEAFENPVKYNIQKGIGVEIIHGIYPAIADSVRGTNKSLYKPESYVEYLRNSLLELSGMNGFNQQVSGADFWRTGNAGAAGSMSSAAGKRRLTEIIIADLSVE